MTSQGSSNTVGSDDVIRLAAGESESVPEESLGVSLIPRLTSNLHTVSLSHARTHTHTDYTHAVHFIFLFYISRIRFKNVNEHRHVFTPSLFMDRNTRKYARIDFLSHTHTHRLCQSRVGNSGQLNLTDRTGCRHMRTHVSIYTIHHLFALT